MARDPTNFQSFLAELKNHGIPVSAVKCLQRVDKEAFMVTFDKPEYCEAFRSRSFVHHAVNPVYSVAVFDAPYEISDDGLRLCLQSCGDVSSVKRLKYAGYDLETRVHLVRMRFMRLSPPSFLRFGRRLVRLSIMVKLQLAGNVIDPDIKLKSVLTPFVSIVMNSAIKPVAAHMLCGVAFVNRKIMLRWIVLWKSFCFC